MKNVDINVKLILALLRAGILGEKPDLGPFSDQWGALSFERVTELAIKHDIVVTIYSALNETDDPNTVRLKKALGRFYAPQFAKCVNQEIEGNALVEAFDRAGIDFIPLKGWALRQLYADPLCRSMADLDILIRNYQYQAVKPVMEQQGFRACGTTGWKHDSFVKEPFMTVELHKRLTDSSGRIREWEGQLWSRCTRREGTEHQFVMSPEDFYVFHLVHMVKDFKNGAFGLRRLGDLWILRRHTTSEDLQAAEKMLANLGLGLFEERMAKLATVCFDGEEMDPDSDLLLQFAAEGAIYSDDQRYKLGRMASSPGKSAASAKIQAVFRAVFLPVGRMKIQFPAVEKHPCLLPLFWLYRIFHFAKHPVTSMKKLNYHGLAEDQYDKIIEVFRAGGIDPDAKRESEHL